MASPVLKIVSSYARDPMVVSAAGIAVLSTMSIVGNVIPFYPKE